MSNSTYFLHDICRLKIGDMEFLEIPKSEETLEPQDESQKNEKLKESHLLLKKKLSLSHELIKQYNDKIKECQEVGSELQAVKENLKKITLKHNSSLSKIVQLELEHEEYRQKVASLSKILPEKETKIAADQQHLQQLICKVQELEKKEKGKCSEIKTLEVELKAAKDSHKIEMKEIEAKLRCMRADVKNQTKKKEAKIGIDKFTCTGDELEPVKLRPETREKSTLTNDFYSIKDDPYPLFCSRCEIKLDPVPLDQILKQMSSCPTLITGVPSPSKKSGSVIRDSRDPEFIRPEVAVNHSTNNVREAPDPVARDSGISKSDFERLEQKICLLERKLHKKTKKEVRSRNSCCGYQYPNNCYLGPYPNLFQPGAMMGPQPAFNQFQNWQDGFSSRKRRRTFSIRKSNSRGSNKSKKKRRLEDGTSEWNVDPLPSRDRHNSDRDITSENDYETLNERLRPETPPFNFSKPKNKPFNRPREHRACPSPNSKKRERVSALFSPARSPSPKLYDEEIHIQPQIKSPEVSQVASEPVSDEEIVENGNQPPENLPEYEIVEYLPRKRGRPPKNAPKTIQKQSLVKKIRNLKKNCNKIKPVANKPVSVGNGKKLTSRETEPGVELLNNISRTQPVNNDEVSNSSSDYCPAKKQRIAHSVCKPKNDSVGEVNRKSPLLEAEKVGIQKENSIIHLVRKDVASETVERIEKLIESVENDKTMAGVENITRILSTFEQENRLRNRVNTKRCHQLVNKTAVKHLELKIATDITTRRIAESQKIENENLNASATAVNETLDDKKQTVPLQPGVMIPQMYLDLAGVEDSGNITNNDKDSDEKEESESATNINLNTKEICDADTSLRILRSISKAIRTSVSETSLKNEESASDHDVPEQISDIHNNPVSVQSDKSEDTNTEVFENQITYPAVATRKYKRKARIAASPVSPMRELRSRRIILSPTKNPQEKRSTEEDDEEMVDEISSKTVQLSENINADIQGFGPKALLNQYFTKRANSREGNSCNKKRFKTKLQKRKENLVLNELHKLAEDPDWKMEVLLDVIGNLSKFKTHTIAKCTIDFLATNAEDGEELDRTHTPPAPLLRKTQQRVLTMLVTLNRTVPNIIKLVQAGIEYRLFLLGYAPELNVIEELTRVFTALARIQKDRERVRILCCDALYCLGVKAMPLIYVILTSWPEILPMAGSNSEPLTLCLTDAIMKQQVEGNYPKCSALKKLVSGYYNYEAGGLIDATFVTSLLTTLREKRQNGLDTAIILLAKKRGPNWTYKNIIQGGLLQMIIQKAHPSIYHAFCLLGHLMRSFPVDDKNGLVKNILEQLIALMESGEGSMQQQEGVATALLSLSRHKRSVVTEAILRWEPSEPISESTSRQLTVLFDNYPTTWWQNLLRKNFRKLS